MDSDLNAARSRLIDALGRQSAFWGVGKVTGQLYAVLYLSPEPVSLGELAAALGVTKGNVSLAIRVLEQLGMVRRSLRPADRRVFFEAEPDFWLITRRVLERRQKPEFEQSFRLVDEAADAARRAGPSFELRRLEALQGFYRELDWIVAAILRLDPRRLARLIRILAKGEGR